MEDKVMEKSHESDSDNSDSEETYTLDELTDMCATADAVLGASDADNCSYSLGYVKRQALYACMTCNGPHVPGSMKGGVCLACANKCHENHKMVELYTKRSFRCDCGNKKFQTPCMLQPEKDAANVGNSYNHNFVGLYCSCERPYPDLEHPENEDEMLQCIVCEDWFHSKHAFGFSAEEIYMGDGKEEECEMICQQCTSSCDFLRNYEHLRVKVSHKSDHVSESNTNAAPNLVVDNNETDKVKATEEKQEAQVAEANPDSKTSELKAEIDVESRAGPSGSSSPTLLSAFVEATCGSSSSSEKTVDSGIDFTVLDGIQDKHDSGLSGAMKEDAKGDCILSKYQKSQPPTTATLWASGWRAQLCKCERCMDMYFKLGVGFIIDENDTLDAYEALGQAKREKEEKEDEAEITSMWSKLDHVSKVEALISINEMKEHLKEFLAKYNGKIFRKRDAEEFAEELKAKRARRMNSSGDGIPPSSCR